MSDPTAETSQESPLPPRREQGPRAQKRQSSALGWIILALLMGMGFGVTCATCGQIVPGGARGFEVIAGGAQQVGVIELLGPISDTKNVVERLHDFSRRKELAAIVLRIDSPGGAVAPSQDVYDAMRRASEKKPVVASMGTMAASGGFWAAMGADWIVASPGSITGSIGVISQIPDFQEVAKFLRVNMRTFKSGPLKDSGNPLRPMTPEDETAFMDLVSDIYDQFMGLVAERRNLDLDAVRRYADGRVFTGRAAYQAGLVDQLGGLYEAAMKAAELAEERSAQKDGREPKPIEEMPTLIYPAEEMPGLLRLLGKNLGKAMAEGLKEAKDQLTSERIEVELR